jgi:cytochrome P450
VSAFERDFFTDPEIIRDPTPYYAALRELGPVVREPHHGVFLVSGLEEILAVYADLDAFSSIVAALGPFTKLPELAKGESIADMIAHRRGEIPLSDLLPTVDPPDHTRLRALLNRLFTPNRLKENEEFMWSLAEGTRRVRGEDLQSAGDSVHEAAQKFADDPILVREMGVERRA